MRTLMHDRTRLTVYPLLAIATTWTIVYGWPFTVDLCLRIFS